MLNSSQTSGSEDAELILTHYNSGQAASAGCMILHGVSRLEVKIPIYYCYSPIQLLRQLLRCYLSYICVIFRRQNERQG
jgi:hypothetical protein